MSFPFLVLFKWTLDRYLLADEGWLDLDSCINSWLDPKACMALSNFMTAISLNPVAFSYTQIKSWIKSGYVHKQLLIFPFFQNILSCYILNDVRDWDCCQTFIFLRVTDEQFIIQVLWCIKGCSSLIIEKENSKFLFTNWIHGNLKRAYIKKKYWTRIFIFSFIQSIPKHYDQLKIIYLHIVNHNEI